MHTYVIQKATTNVSIELEIVDSTDGTPETGVVWNTSGIDLQYRRDGAASTSITEATLAALTTAHTDGGFLHIGNGVYRFDLPDAACATGVDKVVVHGTVTGMVVIPCVIQLVSYDPFDSVRMGMTALPNAAADAAGGLPISDAGGLDLDTQLAATNEITAARMGALTDWINGGRLDLILDIIAADVVNIDGAAMRGTDSAATATELAKVPKSDGTATWNSTALASINAEADTAISDAGLATAAKLLAYIQLLARSDAAIETDNSAELTEINADGGSGAGNFSAQTDSGEAIRDHVGDGTNLSEAGGTGDHLTAIPWNAAWDAEVESEVTDGLNAYDPPTRAELTTDINSILTTLGTPAGADLVADIAANLTAINALNDLSAAEVNAEVLDVFNTDTFAESSGVPAATATLIAKIVWMATLARNKITQTSTTQTLRNDADSADVAASTTSDAAGTATRGEFT